MSESERERQRKWERESDRQRQRQTDRQTDRTGQDRTGQDRTDRDAQRQTDRQRQTIRDIPAVCEGERQKRADRRLAPGIARAVGAFSSPGRLQLLSYLILPTTRAKNDFRPLAPPFTRR